MKNILLMIILFSSYFSFGQAEYKFISMARSRANRGDYTGAIELYSAAIQTRPYNPHFYSERAEIKETVNDLQGAIEDYIKSYLISPDNLIFNAIKSIAENQDDFSIVLHFLNQLIEENPSFINAYLLRGRIKSDCLLNSVDAANDYTRVLEIDPLQSDIYISFNKVVKKVPDPQKLMVILNQVIKKYSNFGEPFFLRGRLKEEQKDFDGAASDYIRALETDFTLYESYLALFRIKGQLKDITQLIFKLDLLITGNPENHTRKWLRGELKEELHDFKGAISDYLAVFSNDPGDVRINNALQRLKGNTDCREELIKQVNELIEKKPDFYEAFMYRGEIEEIKADFYGAFADFLHVFIKKPGNDQIKQALTRIISAYDKPVELLRQVNELIEKKPDFYEAYILRGQIREADKDDSGAIKDYLYALAFNKIAYSPLLNLRNKISRDRNKLAGFDEKLLDADKSNSFSYSTDPFVYEYFINYHIGLGKIMDSLKIDPATIHILIDKSGNKLTVLSGFVIIKQYPAVFGDNFEDKLCQGDKCTPEGTFSIISKYPHQEYDYFIYINYPNADSWRKHNLAKKEGKIPPDAEIGGEIGIHGIWGNEDMEAFFDDKRIFSAGCIMLKKKDINDLYPFISASCKIVIQK
jgi:tetratricopeptide (TPR) repeat protein